MAGNGNGNGNGNGTGNGNGNGKPDAAAAQSQPSAAPGNSGNAPGQEKKDGQDAKPAHGNGGPAPASAQQQSTSGPTQGVKPSNSTAKNTNAPAGSNKTKLYGNGHTAGQIAIQNGYPSSGNLYGPGNSQPHKVTTCGHRHGVDVHALKSHPASVCGTPQRPPTHVPSTPERPIVVVTPHDPSVPSSTPAHDSGGRTGTAVAARAGGHAFSGALAATGVADATLPFTGFPLWAAALAAAILIGTGLTVRRLARAKS